MNLARRALIKPIRLVGKNKKYNEYSSAFCSEIMKKEQSLLEKRTRVLKRTITLEDKERILTKIEADINKAKRRLKKLNGEITLDFVKLDSMLENDLLNHLIGLEQAIRDKLNKLDVYQTRVFNIKDTKEQKK